MDSKNSQTTPATNSTSSIRQLLGAADAQTAHHATSTQRTNHWAPRTRKRHQQEHRPQRPTESSNPTQHAKGRTGDCPGPHKGTSTRRNVTRGGGGGWHDACVACCLTLAAPIGLSPLPLVLSWASHPFSGVERGWWGSVPRGRECLVPTLRSLSKAWRRFSRQCCAGWHLRWCSDLRKESPAHGQQRCVKLASVWNGLRHRGGADGPGAPLYP